MTAMRPLASPQTESFIRGGGVHLEVKAVRSSEVWTLSRYHCHQTKATSKNTPTTRRAMISIYKTSPYCPVIRGNDLQSVLHPCGAILPSASTNKMRTRPAVTRKAPSQSMRLKKKYDWRTMRRRGGNYIPILCHVKDIWVHSEVTPKEGKGTESSHHV